MGRFVNRRRDYFAKSKGTVSIKRMEPQEGKENLAVSLDDAKDDRKSE